MEKPKQKCFVATPYLNKKVVSKQQTRSKAINDKKISKTWQQDEKGEVWGRDLERKKLNNKNNKARYWKTRKGTKRKKKGKREDERLKGHKEEDDQREKEEENDKENEEEDKEEEEVEQEEEEEE